MPVFKEMDPELIWRAIEGYTDEITPAVKTRDAFYRQFRCPRCDCELNKEFDVRTCFNGEDIAPKAQLRCPNCSYLVEPHTNVVIEFGDASKIPVYAIPLLEGPED